ncbi:Zinc finger, C2H2 [Cordyceps fumosorosea ARSEF 2679]|uniref:Zinc finger, C2H2 n=1 Tax=Cordyceps fumosorosea (strain ARSEF 2679) TaxID=1081104 RepID=A0A162JNL1_CORFA|nr:Zinc finger, C2H2 [Cordyceps fumosorosea ARSEF 2679]OAA71522.1 Zinc finger, C2H2 [Cordyceps fumosorosea ARSEF 2679]
MSDTDTNIRAMPPTREPSASPTTATIKITDSMDGIDDFQEAGKTSAAPDDGGDAKQNDDDDDENQSTSRPYGLSDYFDIRTDCFTGKMRNTFTCPRGETQCDGFVFASIEECQAHEHDWHAGPYRCLVCGQAFASGTRLRRHTHYEESESRRVEVEAAEARRGGCAAVRVYHGNDPARSRARRFAKMVRAEEAETEKAQRRARKEAERTARQAKKNKKEGIDDEPLVVIGADEGEDIATGCSEEDGAASCQEPCCPFFGKSFASTVAYARHVAAQGHVVAVAMGEALVEQLTAMVRAKASTTVKNPDDDSRARTPPRQRPTYLPSPPPTPHTVADGEENGLASSAWDDEEGLPMMLERRLDKTRRALRELRCNAPGCEMYGRRMATSQGYWSHLASGQHTAALKAWCERGGEAVYVSA